MAVLPAQEFLERKNNKSPSTINIEVTGPEPKRSKDSGIKWISASPNKLPTAKLTKARMADLSRSELIDSVKTPMSEIKLTSVTLESVYTQADILNYTSFNCRRSGYPAL